VNNLLEITAVYWITAFLVGGIGCVFFWTDRRGATTRALALCLNLIACSLFMGTLPKAWQFLSPQWHDVWFETIQHASIIIGIEWGRRVGLVLTGKLGTAVSWLFRCGQILIVIALGLTLLYTIIAPEFATKIMTGAIRLRGAEIAVFAPIIGSSMILCFIALNILMLSKRVDKAEKVRLRALIWASPFLLLA
jgi:adenylate cyclase